MGETKSRSVRHGAIAGVLAGLLFATFQILGALALGRPWSMPPRLFASVVLGSATMNPDTVSELAAVVTGSLVHVGLSTAFGGIYGAAYSGSSIESRSSWGRQLAVAGLFGILLWVVNFQLIARNFYPWFLSSPQVLQLVLHAAFFGMPLGLLFASLERLSGRLERRRFARSPMGARAGAPGV